MTNDVNDIYWRARKKFLLKFVSYKKRTKEHSDIYDSCLDSKRKRFIRNSF